MTKNDIIETINDFLSIKFNSSIKCPPKQDLLTTFSIQNIICYKNYYKIKILLKTKINEQEETFYLINNKLI